MSKKIIVLSDGTGNSAAKVWRTNVWRTFEALDLTRSDQVAMYDDGVGTSSFKPVAILGGAFGYGLKRNVLSLYKFLCRNYKSRQDYQAEGIQSEDDDIFAFGFSRGAFTIRVLVGLVLDQGLVNYETEDELDRKTKAAYRQYRAKNFKTYTGIEVLFRWIRSWFVSASHDSAQRAVSHVRFLGLWDTVAAYGFPVDELTRGVSRYLWPLELPNRQLDTDRVRKACHALSIDDERTTFHPVLWDETDIPRPPIQRCGIRRTRSERVSQVWFAGVHANVGGGYPDDSLAHVSLTWIMQEASYCGLRFKRPPVADPDAVINLKSSQDKDGRLYDSRSGIGGYYRYGPRKIAELCHSRLSLDPRDRVQIDLPKIHYSVFDRLTVAAHFYAPVGIPEKYQVVARNGLIVPPRKVGEPRPRAKLRAALEELTVWNLVWQRRAVYFLTVAVSLHLVTYPLMHQFSSAGELTTKLRFVSDSVRILGALLPLGGWRWADAYAKDPLEFLIASMAVVVVTLVGSKLGGSIRDQVRTIWNISTRHSDTRPALALIREQRSARYKGAWNYVFYLALLATALSPLLFERGASFPKLAASLWEQLDQVPIVAKAATSAAPAFDELRQLTESVPVVSALGRYLSILGQDLRTVFGAVSRGNIPIFAAILLFVLLLPDRMICSLRTSYAYRWSLSFLRLKLAPAVLALGLVYFCSALVGRYFFVVRDGAGNFCISTPKNQLKQPKCNGPVLAACIKAVSSQASASDTPPDCKSVCKPETILIDTRSLCAATGMSLASGQGYNFEIKMATEKDLTDAETEEVGQKVKALASANGGAAPETVQQQTLDVQKEFRRRGLTRDNLKWQFCYDYFNLFCYESGVQKVLQPSLLQSGLAIVTTPLKRTLDRPLGNVIVRYGNTGNEEAFVDPDPKAPDKTVNDTPIHPTVKGELFVYLDKPVTGFWPDMFNASNSGIARITVTAHAN
jgi:uncharacterized protein (DUF2235 family)